MPHGIKSMHAWCLPHYPARADRRDDGLLQKPTPNRSREFSDGNGCACLKSNTAGIPAGPTFHLSCRVHPIHVLTAPGCEFARAQRESLVMTGARLVAAAASAQDALSRGWPKGTIQRCFGQGRKSSAENIRCLLSTPQESEKS